MNTEEMYVYWSTLFNGTDWFQTTIFPMNTRLAHKNINVLKICYQFMKHCCKSKH